MAPPVRWRIGDGALRQSVATVGDGGFYMPAGFLDDLGRQFLGHLDVPGRMRLLPWDPYGVKLEAAYAALASPGTERTLDDFGPRVAAVDRFRRLRMGSDGRLGLSSETRFHLGVQLGGEVLVWRYPAGLEVWTQEYRASRLRMAPLEGTELIWGDDDS